jgi:dipeptidyl aminopeptidase/acylaminoacyl peptidase
MNGQIETYSVDAFYASSVSPWIITIDFHRKHYNCAEPREMTTNPLEPSKCFRKCHFIYLFFYSFLASVIVACQTTVTIPTQELIPTAINSTIIPYTATPKPSSTPTQTLLPIKATAQPSLTSTYTSMPASSLGDDAYLAAGQIAITGFQGDGIKIVNADGSNLRNIDLSVFGVSVAWSPDGNWIAYDNRIESNNFEKTTSQIFVMDKDGKNQRQITNSNYYKYGLSWSPSGQEISFSPSFPEDIVAVQKDGNYLRKITNLNHGVSYGVWSPDGTQMAFDYATKGINFWPPEGIAFINVSDGIPKWIIKFPVNEDGRIDWSPDGKYITFSSNYHGDVNTYWPLANELTPTIWPELQDCGDIFTVKIDGSELKQLTHLPECSKSPVWSPDGQYIAFLVDVNNVANMDTQNTDWEVFIMKRDGGEITQITKNAGGPWVKSISWSRVPGLRIGKTYSLTQLGDKLTVRDKPSLESNQVSVLRVGAQVTVLSAAVNNDNYYWRQVKLENGDVGWVQEVGGWFAPVEAP